MTLGNIGKVLTSQALETTKTTVLDAVLGPETPAKPAAPAPAPSVDTGAVIVGQIQAMQRPLGPDQELQVLFRAGHEMLRVTEIYVPNSHVLVFAGHDAAGNVTRVITPVEAAQVVCKIVKVVPGAAPLRINVMTPKPPQPKPAG